MSCEVSFYEKNFNAGVAICDILFISNFLLSSTTWNLMDLLSVELYFYFSILF